MAYVTLYNWATGASRKVESADVRLFTMGGVWKTTPQPRAATQPTATSPHSWSTTPGFHQEEKDAAQLSQADLQAAYYTHEFISRSQLVDTLTNRFKDNFTGDLQLAIWDAEAAGGASSWEEVVLAQAYALFHDGADQLGFLHPSSVANSFVNSYWPAIRSDVLKGAKIVGQFDPNDPRNLPKLIQRATDAFLKRWTYGDFAAGANGPRGPGGGSGLSASSFDEQQLANEVISMYRTYLRGDPKVDAKALAKQYISQVVANPNQAVHFQTWVRGHMEKDPRWGKVFNNKPEGISEEEYIGQYAQMAIQTLGAGASGIDATIQGGAGLAASPEGYMGRLALHENVQKSGQFMSGIEDQFRKARKVLGAL